jgi:quinone-modifying oxidoreductase subunit QmoB
MDKVGVFLCSGCGIGDAVDLEAVAKAAKGAGAAATLTHACCCAAEGLQAARDFVAGNALNGLVIGACAERARAEFALADPAGVHVALREHCAWSHPAGDEDTACWPRIWSHGAAHMKGCKPIGRCREISDTVWCWGGPDWARIAAAMGHPVLIERSDTLGGRLLLAAPENA